MNCLVTIVCSLWNLFYTFLLRRDIHAHVTVMRHTLLTDVFILKAQHYFYSKIIPVGQDVLRCIPNNDWDAGDLPLMGPVQSFTFSDYSYICCYQNYLTKRPSGQFRTTWSNAVANERINHTFIHNGRHVIDISFLLPGMDMNSSGYVIGSYCNWFRQYSIWIGDAIPSFMWRKSFVAFGLIEIWHKDFVSCRYTWWQIKNFYFTQRTFFSYVFT